MMTGEAVEDGARKPGGVSLARIALGDFERLAIPDEREAASACRGVERENQHRNNVLL
jgi:hypothetical protein